MNNSQKVHGDLNVRTKFETIVLWWTIDQNKSNIQEESKTPHAINQNIPVIYIWSWQQYKQQKVISQQEE